MPDQARQVLDTCIECLQSLKADDILLLDLREVADFTDYFLLCTGNSDPHVKAIADAVQEGMKAAGQRPWHVEGLNNRRWVAFDFVDFVVHIFQGDARSFYGLERLWGDAPSEQIEENPPLVETN
ncbi:MAG: ribosome silencing factor [bacterium]|nr:ribosome silencing factor [bacterium]